MNNVNLIGRLTKDPVVNMTSNGTSVAHYTLAVDGGKNAKGERVTDFIPVTVFGDGATFVENYLKKGMRILVTGRLSQDNYTNKDGVQVYSLSVIGLAHEFLDSKRETAETSAE